MSVGSYIRCVFLSGLPLHLFKVQPCCSMYHVISCGGKYSVVGLCHILLNHQLLELVGCFHLSCYELCCCKYSCTGVCTGMVSVIRYVPWGELAGSYGNLVWENTRRFPEQPHFVCLSSVRKVPASPRPPWHCSVLALWTIATLVSWFCFVFLYQPTVVVFLATYCIWCGKNACSNPLLIFQLGCVFSPVKL